MFCSEPGGMHYQHDGVGLCHLRSRRQRWILCNVQCGVLLRLCHRGVHIFDHDWDRISHWRLYYCCFDHGHRWHY